MKITKHHKIPQYGVRTPDGEYKRNGVAVLSIADGVRSTKFGRIADYMRRTNRCDRSVLEAEVSPVDDDTSPPHLGARHSWPKLLSDRLSLAPALQPDVPPPAMCNSLRMARPSSMPQSMYQ